MSIRQSVDWASPDGQLLVASVYRQMQRRVLRWPLIALALLTVIGMVWAVYYRNIFFLLAAAVLAGSLSAGIAIGATFGLARALPLLAARLVDTAPKLREQHLRLARWAPRARAGAVAVQAATVLGVVVVLAVTATTAGGSAT